MSTATDVGPPAHPLSPRGSSGGSPRGASAAAGPLRTRARRLVLGASADPTWARPALIALLVATAALYLVDLGASGWANSFYSAAAQAGSTSWKAFFFGSSDAGNSITVDKPPASLWVMGLSVRLFGLSAWSILVPQALIGVASVGVLHGAVKRVAGAGAGLLAGAVFALTPVAALMFRFNNPDALLVLLMTGAAYAVVRAVQDGRTRWLVLAGVLLGLGFLTKQLQVLLALPPLAAAYLWAGPRGLWRRVLDLLAAGLALVASAGWWVAVVELTPAHDRPFIGGSQTNDFLQLTFGYNGFGRLDGNEVGSVGGGASAAARGGGGGSAWGATGIGRLFSAEMGGQISWLIPAALVLLAAGLWLTRRAARTDAVRASLILWGGWLLVTGAVFSFASGIIHPYYTVALAPAVAALVGIGATLLWRRRTSRAAAAVMAAATAASAGWAAVLLDRSSAWHPWLRWLVLAAGLVAAAGLLTPLAGRRLGRVGVRLLAPAGALAVAACVAAPAAYAVQTASTAHSGGLPSAGPAVAGAVGFGAGGPGGHFTWRGAPAGTTPGAAPGATAGRGGFPGGAGGFGGGTGRFGGAGRMGGLLNATTPSAALTKVLEADASSYTWVAAAVGSNNASGYQLATQDPVMPIGGFNGSDPSPTLAQFQADVADGKIHYFIGSSIGGRQSGGSDVASTITAWVQAHYTARTVGSTTLYDLTSGASAPAST